MELETNNSKCHLSSPTHDLKKNHVEVQAVTPTNITPPLVPNLPPSVIASLIAQQQTAALFPGAPAIQMPMVLPFNNTSPPTPTPALPPGVIPSQVLQLYAIPTSEGLKLVVQDTTNTNLAKIESTANSTEEFKAIDRKFSSASFSPTSSNEMAIPPKKRRHYDGSTSSRVSPDVDVKSDERTNSRSSLEDDAQSKERNSYSPESHERYFSSSGRSYKYPHLSEEKMKTMSQEDIKRERNRLAADRCRKKKLAKIDQLTKQVQQMEKQRRQVLFQLDSLRHAALAARDIVQSHRMAGCRVIDDSGVLNRLIAETESLDSFVKSQL